VKSRSFEARLNGAMSQASSLLRLPRRFRRNVGAFVVDNFFRGMSRMGKLHPDAKPGRHDVEVIHDVPYGDAEISEHRLDVYRPLALARGEVESVPVVLYVHGGGFRILSKDTHWIMGLAFARRGYLVFNISYRLAPRHRFPAALTDVCTAYDWVTKNAGRYGGDPERLVLAGESAGANLVTALALATSYRRDEPWARRVFDSGIRPKAVVAACGIYHVSDIARFKRRWPGMSDFINDRLNEVKDAYLGDPERHGARALELADPLIPLERGDLPARPLPPFFAPCGTRDPLIDDTQRLAAALQKMNVECDARYYEGELHAFHALVFTPNARRCWGHIYRFLDRHLAPSDAAASVDVGT
jgi:acetyl esterase/lipase